MVDVPCLVKWIGSKRIQSGEIVQYFPTFISTYYEPFCGGCSVLFQLLSSGEHYVNRCVCSDINGDLIDLWNTVKNDPDGLFFEYERMWNEMSLIDDRQDKRHYFEIVRNEFNQTRSPYLFFFIMRTCTNGIPRYNRFGEFNNTYHITRDGIKPRFLKKIIVRWSDMLNEHDVLFRRCDYRNAIDSLDKDDFVYLDPPYRMTRSTGKYFGDVDYNGIFDNMRRMNDRGVKYALSFDDTSGKLSVPFECFDNVINVVSKNAGYRKTELKMDNKDVYESLYLN